MSRSTNESNSLIPIESHPFIHDMPEDTLSRVADGLRFLGAIAVHVDLEELANTKGVESALYDYIFGLESAVEFERDRMKNGGAA